MRRPAPAALLAAASVIAIAALCGWGLSLATRRVVNWFVMTDELYYERLAIAVAQTGSLVPRLHGEVVSNINQLYPALLSLVYGNGDVPASLAAAHRLNAFVMASAAIPVYLLARRLALGRLVGLAVSALAVATPWIVLASFLLTEVVAYPVFCWAVLALVEATRRKSTRADVVAIVAIGLAVTARTQFVVLALVLVAAVATEALWESAAAGRRGTGLVRSAAASLLRGRRLLLAAVAGVALLLLAAAIAGSVSDLLGAYAVTAEGIRLDDGLLRLVAEQWGVLALATGIVPFLLAAAWVLDRLRPSTAPAERAFATVGLWVLVAIGLEVASFNQRFGADEVKDRYLFYVVPVVLVAVAAAIRGRRWPRLRAWLLPTAVAAAGLALAPLPVYEKLNVDSPATILNDGILRLATSRDWAHVLLPLAVAVSVLAFLLATTLRPRLVALAIAVVPLVVALPGGAVLAFDRLFAVDGTNGLPVTLDQGVVFNWVDRTIGKDGRVTMLRYPVNAPDYWAGVAYWWDAEFWNESVVALDTPVAQTSGDLPWVQAFDRRTGVAARPGATRYVLQHGSDVRFALAGRRVAFDRGAYLSEPERPWRADWVVADGIYGDGWTLPHIPVRVRVFPEPGQAGPVRRFLTVSIAAPEAEEPRPVTITSNDARWDGSIPPATSIDRGTSVCVRADAPAEVEIETPYVSDVYRDPTQGALTGEVDRPVGILIRSIALADETEAVAGCSGDRASSPR